MMQVGVVNTFVGGDRTLTVDQNWARAQEIFAPVVAHARETGVTLAFENCPMIFSHDEWPGGHNIAYAPKIWRRIFETWGDAVGMNYDPSHLVWQMIDQPRFIREFGAHMVHVHAKDLMIDRDGLYENGILSLGMGWQVPRMPGLGEVDWPAFFSGLYRAGYDGPVIIEHEDRNFEGSDEQHSTRLRTGARRAAPVREVGRQDTETDREDHDEETSAGNRLAGDGGRLAGMAQAEGYKIGISNTVQGNGWREEMVCAMKAEALASGKVDSLNIAHRNTDAAGQLEDIRNLIQAGVNAIVVNPANADGINAAIKEATDAGHRRRGGRPGGDRAFGLHPVEQPGGIRLSRREVAVRDDGRQGCCRLHARCGRCGRRQ